MTKKQQRLIALRQDKIIYGIEAIVVNTICLVLLLIADQFPLPNFVSSIVVITAVLYTGYALIGNLFRLLEIKKLEATK